MAERTWFITGVSSGLGREMASQLLERGERVAGLTETLPILMISKAPTASACFCSSSTTPRQSGASSKKLSRHWVVSMSSSTMRLTAFWALPRN